MEHRLTMFDGMTEFEEKTLQRRRTLSPFNLLGLFA